jgi:hypothetical protein
MKWSPKFQYKFAADTTIKLLSVHHFTRLGIIQPRFTPLNFQLPSTFTVMSSCMAV